MSYSKLLKEIMYDEDNISYTEKGIKPLFSAPETAHTQLKSKIAEVQSLCTIDLS